MRKNRLLTAFSFLVFMFMFIPLAIIVVTSFGEGSTIEFPISGFTLKWYSNIFASRTFVSGFTLSLQIGLLATILALIVGIPAAYALSRSELAGKSRIKSFFLSPTIVPGV
ncbi:MAG: ABC transporter permease, partial [Youngiibacter sp.]|nr:ABC transporter permease [Youngiibacter sp.]